MVPLRLLPLGGLGEVGMNCLAIEYGHDLIVIDCGVTFPKTSMGVDLIHPDFSWILERKDRLRAIVLTHGHEDHLGAVPYLLRHQNVPIYGPPYALGLLEQRLGEHLLGKEVELHPTVPGQPFKLGIFEVEPVAVSHSMWDSTGLIFQTPIGQLVHSGDFKLDGSSPAVDQRRLREAADAGVRLLLSDSTNADVEGRAGNEADVARVLEELIAAAPQRVVVSLFASNASRLSALLRIAQQHGRKVCLLGRSLHTHVRVATTVGAFADPSQHLVESRAAARLPRHELLIIAGGAQGEARAALSRLAHGNHKHIELDAGDEVILSARTIPGNEHPVFSLIDRFERRAIRVHAAAWTRGLHVSGHACREEQRELLELIRPQTFVPIHGTYRQLTSHAALAREIGVDGVMLAENGTLLEVGRESISCAGHVSIPRVHRRMHEVVAAPLLSERGLLGQHGFVVAVWIPADGEAREGTPWVRMGGVADGERYKQIVSAVERALRSTAQAVGSVRSQDEIASLRSLAEQRVHGVLRKELRDLPALYVDVRGLH